MRVCEKHLNRATESLVSRKTGQEYDLCEICEKELASILHETEKVPEIVGLVVNAEKVGRLPGRPKTNKQIK